MGLHWGAYVTNEPERVPEVFHALFRLYEEGSIRPILFGTYPLEQVPQALDALGSRRTYGKVIVTP